jgi:hypothetical protein
MSKNSKKTEKKLKEAQEEVDHKLGVIETLGRFGTDRFHHRDSDSDSDFLSDLLSGFLSDSLCLSCAAEVERGCSSRLSPWKACQIFGVLFQA